MDLLTTHIVICAVFLLAACSPIDYPSPVPENSSPTGSSKTSYVINTRNDTDQVTVVFEGETTLFEVGSPSGIGGAQIAVIDGKLSDPTAIRLFLGGLENFTLLFEDVILTLSVSSTDPELILRSVQINNGSPQEVQPDSPYWMEVNQDKDSVNQEPSFVVSLPAAMFQSGTTVFEISWIDYFR